MSEVLGEQIILPFGASVLKPSADFVTSNERDSERYILRTTVSMVRLSDLTPPATDFNVLLLTNNSSGKLLAQDAVYNERLTATRTEKGIDFTTNFADVDPADYFTSLARAREDKIQQDRDELQPEIKKLSTRVNTVTAACLGMIMLSLSNRFGYDFLISDTPYNDLDRFFDSLILPGVLPMPYIGMKERKLNNLYMQSVRKADQMKRLNGFIASVGKNGLHPKPTEIK